MWRSRPGKSHRVATSSSWLLMDFLNRLWCSCRVIEPDDLGKQCDAIIFWIRTDHEEVSTLARSNRTYDSRLNMLCKVREKSHKMGIATGVMSTVVCKGIVKAWKPIVCKMEFWKSIAKLQAWMSDISHLAKNSEHCGESSVLISFTTLFGHYWSL